MMESLLTRIRREASERDPFLIAIDGRCSAGKSTLAAELAAALDANLIHIDDFFLRPEQRTETRLATPGENIDHERFFTEVLCHLRTGEAFAYRPFSCATKTLGPPVTVTPKPVTIVEGSYSCHPALRDQYDLRLFVTVDPEEQMRRLRERDGGYAEVFRQKWIPLEEAYFAKCGVETCCHQTLSVAQKKITNSPLKLSPKTNNSICVCLLNNKKKTKNY